MLSVLPRRQTAFIDGPRTGLEGRYAVALGPASLDRVLPEFGQPADLVSLVASFCKPDTRRATQTNVASPAIDLHP